MIPVKPLRELGVAVLDCEHRTPKDAGQGYPYIAIPDIQNGRVRIADTRLISAEDLEEWTKRTKPRCGDILVTRRGRVGDSAPVPVDQCAIGQNLVILRSDGALLDQTYLRWACRSPQWWKEVDKFRNVGAVFSSLNVRDIAEISIPAPTITNQRRIAAVLEALDNKIVVNWQVIAAADALGRQLAKKHAAGGADCSLGGVAELLTRGTAPKYSDSGYLVLNQKCVRNGRIDASAGRTMSALPKATGKILRKGDVLVNSTGQGTLGRVARWTRTDEAVSVDSHISIVRIDPLIADPDYVGTLLLDREADIEALAEGTTGQTELGRVALGALPLVLPALDVQRLVGERLRSMGSLMDAKATESEVLASTRDELLPLLMSGEITVTDAEKRVEQEI